MGRTFRLLLVSAILLHVTCTETMAGESERVLHQLFDDAKKTKPSIIFLDELDALVRQADVGSRPSVV